MNCRKLRETEKALLRKHASSTKVSAWFKTRINLFISKMKVTLFFFYSENNTFRNQINTSYEQETGSRLGINCYCSFWFESMVLPDLINNFKNLSFQIEDCMTSFSKSCFMFWEVNYFSFLHYSTMGNWFLFSRTPRYELVLPLTHNTHLGETRLYQWPKCLGLFTNPTEGKIHHIFLPVQMTTEYSSGLVAPQHRRELLMYLQLMQAPDHICQHSKTLNQQWNTQWWEDTMLSKLRRSWEQKENRAWNGVTQELLLSPPKFYGKLRKWISEGAVQNVFQ